MKLLVKYGHGTERKVEIKTICHNRNSVFARIFISDYPEFALPMYRLIVMFLEGHYKNRVNANFKARNGKIKIIVLGQKTLEIIDTLRQEGLTIREDL